MQYNKVFLFFYLTLKSNLYFSGFKASSALFRHEVAFIFGQMQDERSVPFLKKTLEDTSEHEMVRHEAAEALGSIATDECTEILKRLLLHTYYSISNLRLYIITIKHYYITFKCIHCYV